MGDSQTLAETAKGAESNAESNNGALDDKNKPTYIASNDISSNNASSNVASSDISAPNGTESSDAQTTTNTQPTQITQAEPSNTNNENLSSASSNASSNMGALDSATSESNPESSSATNIAQNGAQDSSRDSSQDFAKTSAPNDSTAQDTKDTATTDDTKKEAIYYVIATSVNVRAEPSTTARIVRKLTLGQSAVVTHIQGDWAKLDAGGWISLALLSAIEPKQKLYTVIPNTLNIREEPLPNARVIGALYKDQRVQVEQVQDDWAKLDSGGWVSRRLLKELK